MKILYLITRAEVGGAQVHLLDLLRGLRDRVDAEVAVGEAGFLADRSAALGIPVHLVPSLKQPMNPVEDIRATRQLVALIRRTNPDLVHAHTSKAGMLGRLAAKVCGVPAVYTAHTWCFAEGTSWVWKAFGLPCELVAGLLCQKIITVSEKNAELARDRWIGKRGCVTTIHNGIADSVFRARTESPGPPVIVMVARFARQKNHSMLLQALSGIREEWKLLFVGDGPLRAGVEQEVRDLNLQGRVEFRGECSGVERVLAEAGIYALATNWEGFPLSILEGMRAGLPVIASDVGGVNEAVAHSETGFLVPPGDMHALRERLTELICQPGLRAQMGAAGRRRYEAEFNADHMLARTLNVYSSVIETAGASAHGGLRPAWFAKAKPRTQQP
jgi:glycosyltransferase involved in cell wall biosynthesis